MERHICLKHLNAERKLYHCEKVFKTSLLKAPILSDVKQASLPMELLFIVIFVFISQT